MRSWLKILIHHWKNRWRWGRFLHWLFFIRLENFFILHIIPSWLLFLLQLLKDIAYCLVLLWRLLSLPWFFFAALLYTNRFGWHSQCIRRLPIRRDHPLIQLNPYRWMIIWIGWLEEICVIVMSIPQMRVLLALLFKSLGAPRYQASERLLSSMHSDMVF